MKTYFLLYNFQFFREIGSKIFKKFSNTLDRRKKDSLREIPLVVDEYEENGRKLYLSQIEESTFTVYRSFF